MNTHWIKEAARLEQSGIDFVMVSVLSIKGSTPREVGARMLVTANHSFGTIGGGHLEFKSIESARQQLKENQAQIVTQDFPLGATLGQCCGGFVSVLFETVIQPKFHIAIFGAGHVGRAIIHCLSQIPCQVSWVDSRADEYPDSIPQHVTQVISDYPVDEIADMPENTFDLVLTHNHQLDLELSEAILKREDSAFLGVIGSKTKSARFQHRLRDKGFSKDQIAHMQCPMGEIDIISKQPGEIAISTLSHLLKVRAELENNTNKAENERIESVDIIDDSKSLEENSQAECKTESK
jgi:xanthine dehydrogenase accessory factor